MSSRLVLGRDHGLETAIALVKRFQLECEAELEDVETTEDGTSFRLSISPRAFPSLERRRDELWVSFVEDRVEA